MVLVEYLLGAGDVEDVLGALVPGNGQDPVQIGADDRVFGGGRLHLCQPVQLAPRLAIDLLGQLQLVDLAAQLVDLGGDLVHLAQLFLDRLHLLAQEVFALVLVHLALDVALDLAAQLEDLKLTGEYNRQLAQALLHIGLFQKLLFLVGIDLDRRGDEITQGAGVVHVGRRHLQLFRQVWHQPDDLGEDILQVAGERLHFLGAVDPVFKGLDPGDQVGVGHGVFDYLDALDSLNQDTKRTVGHLEHLVDDGGGSYLEYVVGARGLDLRITDGGQADHLVFVQNVVDQLDRTLLPHSQRRHRFREDDSLPQG